MAFLIPNKGLKDDYAQSILFQEYLDVLAAGVSGVDCVLSGCAVGAGSGGMNLSMTKGSVLTNGVMYALAAVTDSIAIGAANATNPRFDLVVVNSSGSVAVRAGTAAAAPVPPTRSTNDVVLAVVHVPANDTSITSGQIVDLKVTPAFPVVLYRQTTALTLNTYNSAQHILNNSGSGLTIPDGLFLSGRILRIRMGGNLLVNNSTPTQTWSIAYGGTTMYAITSGAATNDTDRRAWFINVDICAQGNSDQTLNGYFCPGQCLAASTAPTTGYGDMWSATVPAAAISGAAAVNSDTANRTLTVQHTFSVSNASNEIVCEYAEVTMI